MSLHTRGPWKYGEYRLTESGNVFVWNEDETVLVCEVSTEEAFAQTCQANAALIAASPELLDAATDAIEFLAHQAHRETAESIIKKLQRAVEKARDISQFVDA